MPDMSVCRETIASHGWTKGAIFRVVALLIIGPVLGGTDHWQTRLSSSGNGPRFLTTLGRLHACDLK